MVFNMMTCSGFSTGIMGGCSVAWLILALLVFLTLIANRQINDWTEVEFSMPGGMVGAILPYFIVVLVTGNYKIGLAVGLIGMLLGGYFGGMLLGGSE